MAIVDPITSLPKAAALFIPAYLAKHHTLCYRQLMKSAERLQFKELAPMLLPWGDTLGGTIAKIIVAQPSLGQCLALAPRNLIHATAAVIHVALERGQQIKNISSNLVANDIRVLLADSIDDLHPRFYKAVSKCGSTIHALQFYIDLNNVLHGPAANMLWDAEAINLATIEIAQAIVKDPVLLAASVAIGCSKRSLGHLTSILAFLRSNHLANTIEQTPAGASWKAILRRVKADLSFARAPAASFSAPGGWRVVRDMSELWLIGRKLRNCVGGIGRNGGDHLRAFMNGQSVFIVHSEPLILASIGRIGTNLWCLGDLSMSGRAPDLGVVRKQLRDDIREALSDVGMAIVETEPFSALSEYLWRQSDEDELEIDELAEMLEEID